MEGDLFTRESRVRMQLTQQGERVAGVVGGDGVDTTTDTIDATVDTPCVVSLLITKNLTAGSTATLEVLDAATGVRLSSRDIDVTANVIMEDDLDDMTEHAADRLDELANRYFPGRVVRKDLVRQVKVGASVPVYVLEFLLGKYCASDDPAAIEAGLKVVNQTLTENFIRPDESEKAKADLKRKGKHRLIDKVDVRFVESDKKFWAALSNFGSKHVNVPEDVVYKYDRLLGGGAWSQLDLVYNDLEDTAQNSLLHLGPQAHPSRSVRPRRLHRSPTRVQQRRMARSRHAHPGPRTKRV